MSAESCRTCTGPSRETVGMMCQECGTDYAVLGRAEDVLSAHRRALNTRACTGCGWRPPRPGRTSDPAAARLRNTEFNRHLAHLIAQPST